MAKGPPARFVEEYHGPIEDFGNYSESEEEEHAREQQPPEARAKVRAPAHAPAGAGEAKDQDAGDEEHERARPAGKPPRPGFGRQAHRPAQGQGAAPPSAQGRAGKPQVTEERLAQLAKARERALEVRRERGELRRKEKALKQLALEARRKRLSDMEKKLGRELAGYAPMENPPVLLDPSAQAEKKSKKRQILIVPSSPADSDADSEDEGGVPQVAPKKPKVVPPVKPVYQQATEELKREEEKAALGAYRQRVDEAKRQLLMQAVFGGGSGVLPTAGTV